MKNKSEQLVQIFKDAETSLMKLSPLNKRQIAKNFQWSKEIDTADINWEKFYEILMFVTFYSGFKAETVNRKYDDLKKALGRLHLVANFDKAKIKAIEKNPKLIRHPQKIKACVSNAQKILKLKDQYGTLQSYLAVFGDLKKQSNLNRLSADLIKRFTYIGNITVSHLLADIGLNTVKPDRVLCRIFYRLGLVKSVKDYAGVIEIGQRIKAATGHSIRYVDLIFVLYGQVGYKYELDIEDGICLEKKPKCHLCLMCRYCKYYKEKKECYK